MNLANEEIYYNDRLRYAARGDSALRRLSQFETFLGYNYVRFYPQNVVPAFSANGGSGHFVVNPKRWLGVVLDVGAVTNQNFAGLQRHQHATVFHWGGPASRSASRALSRLPGRVRRRLPHRQFPVHGAPRHTVLPHDLDGTTVVGEVGTSQTSSPWRPALAWTSRSPGTSPSVRARRYYYTRIGNLRDPGDNSQNNLRYSAGINMMFGGEKPALPAARAANQEVPGWQRGRHDRLLSEMNLSLSLSAHPAELCPGETAQLNVGTGGASMSQLNFAWTLNGQPYSQDKSGVFTATDPGTYTVGLNASGNQFSPAAAKTTIVVKEYVAPTGTVQANPAQIAAGDKSSLSANFNGQCGGPIQAPRYMASEGSIQGDQFDSSPCSGILPITRSSTRPSPSPPRRRTARVKEPPRPPSMWSRGHGRSDSPPRSFLSLQQRFPANNCGKRVLLEQLRSDDERDNTGTVVLVGPPVRLREGL